VQDQRIQKQLHTVNPGLYAVGAPDKSSDVLVSANYKLSFDALRKALKGLNAWVLVLDTKGINVWCAAGKGTFGTDELIRLISLTKLDRVVDHRRIIVPQLGAPGISAHKVKKDTGFKVCYGPVRAEDISAYIVSGYKATTEMRTVTFPLIDRLILAPMEINPAMKKHYPVYA
jgi:CO dehydrogenase/acetyl-CoA synthase gamma subunit (corrinoid Fe-S protein)